MRLGRVEQSILSWFDMMRCSMSATSLTFGVFGPFVDEGSPRAQLEAVRRALRRLKAKGMIEVAELGTGRRSTLWQPIGAAERWAALDRADAKKAARPKRPRKKRGLSIREIAALVRAELRLPPGQG